MREGAQEVQSFCCGGVKIYTNEGGENHVYASFASFIIHEIVNKSYDYALCSKESVKLEVIMQFYAFFVCLNYTIFRIYLSNFRATTNLKVS
jgi:tryptophan-rich sensory protein